MNKKEAFKKYTQLLIFGIALILFSGSNLFAAITVDSTSIAPTIVFPGDTDVAMFHFSITAGTEDTTVSTINVTNAAGNFDVPTYTSGNITAIVTDEGVVKAKLYRSDDAMWGSDTLIQTIDNNGAVTFNSTSIVSFESIGDLIPSGSTQDYFIVYDIGESTNILNYRYISAQIPVGGILAVESSSGEVLSSAAAPASADTSDIAGLTYKTDADDLKSLVSEDNIIGSGMSSPVLYFELEALNTAVTLNSVAIRNDGTIPFTTNSADSNGVVTAYLYSDDGNKDLGSTDTLLQTLTMGSSNNTSTVATFGDLELVIPTDNTQGFILEYLFGEGIASQSDGSGNVTSYADGNLNDATASVNSSVGITSLSGTLPSAVSPSANVYIEDVTITVRSVTEIAPTMGVQGQVSWPMLWVELYSDSNVPSVSVSVENTQGNFSSINAGISRVLVFQDSNADGVIDSNEPLFGSATSFTQSNQLSIVSGVSVPVGISYLIIAYDVGVNFDLAQYATVQLSAITEGSTGVVVAGNFPQPLEPTHNFVTSNIITLSDFKVDDLKDIISNTSDDSFTLSVDLTNRLSESVTIKTIQPRFYHTDLGGKDISSEYTITSASTILSIGSEEEVSASFTIDPSRVTSEGSVYLDMFVEYQITDDIHSDYSSVVGYAQRNRYQDTTGTVGAVGTTPYTFTVSNIEAAVPFEFEVPHYIESVQVEKSSGVWKTFKNNDAVILQSKMRITLAEKGSSIDPTSLTLSRSGTSYVQAQSAIGDQSESITYTYDQETGVIELDDLGDMDGDISISAQDTLGNTFSESVLYYFISSDIQIKNFLVYPNPYSPSVSDEFLMGYNLTQNASRVRVFIYDSTGREVIRFTNTTSISLGYNTISWDGILGSGKSMASGIYILKIVVEGANNGKQAMAITKLAVY